MSYSRCKYGNNMKYAVRSISIDFWFVFVSGRERWPFQWSKGGGLHTAAAQCAQDTEWYLETMGGQGAMGEPKIHIGFFSGWWVLETLFFKGKKIQQKTTLNRWFKREILLGDFGRFAQGWGVAIPGGVLRRKKTLPSSGWDRLFHLEALLFQFRTMIIIMNQWRLEDCQIIFQILKKWLLKETKIENWNAFSLHPSSISPTSRPLFSLRSSAF